MAESIQPEQMLSRLYMWRQQNKALCNYAEKCEDKNAGREEVKGFTPSEELYPYIYMKQFDRSRILDYVFEENPNPFLRMVSRILSIESFTRPRTRKVIPGPRMGITDRFVRLPCVPTTFDRVLDHQSRESAGDYYRDVRELTIASEVKLKSEQDA